MSTIGFNFSCADLCCSSGFLAPGGMALHPHLHLASISVGGANSPIHFPQAQRETDVPRALQDWGRVWDQPCRLVTAPGPLRPCAQKEPWITWFLCRPGCSSTDTTIYPTTLPFYLSYHPISMAVDMQLAIQVFNL